jgi:hypothetical protein
VTGWGVQFWRSRKHIPTAADVQAAIELAGERYRAIFGMPPTHVLLPAEVGPDSLQLWTLQVATGHSHAGWS